MLALWSLTALSLALENAPEDREGQEAARYVAFVAGILMLVSVASLGVRLLDGSDDDAVIVADSVDVLSGPGAQYDTEFKLHAGAEARLVEERASWSRVALGDDQFQDGFPRRTWKRVTLP